MPFVRRFLSSLFLLKGTQAVVIESSPEELGPDGASPEPGIGCGLPHHEQNRWFSGIVRPQCEQSEAIGWRITK
jgi:hypothetical protein